MSKTRIHRSPLGRGVSRREFLQWSAVGGVVATFPSALLTGCGDSDSGGSPLTADQSVPWWLQNNFAPVEDETEFFDLSIRGAIPPEINGTYVRNGSNPRTKSSPHWFLGDGMLHGLRIENGRALWYRNRYVQTPFYQQSVSFDGAIDAQLFPFGPNSQSNVSAIYHAGKLLSSGEVGFPYLINPSTLETVDFHDFNQQLTTSFTAHPKIDPATGYLHSFGYGFVEPLLDLSCDQ